MNELLKFAELLTVAEAAELTKFSQDRIRKAISSGELQALKPGQGTDLRIYHSDLMLWVHGKLPKDVIQLLVRKLNEDILTGPIKYVDAMGDTQEMFVGEGGDPNIMVGVQRPLLVFDFVWQKGRNIPLVGTELEIPMSGVMVEAVVLAMTRYDGYCQVQMEISPEMAEVLFAVPDNLNEATIEGAIQYRDTRSLVEKSKLPKSWQSRGAAFELAFQDLDCDLLECLILGETTGMAEHLVRVEVSKAYPCLSFTWVRPYPYSSEWRPGWNIGASVLGTYASIGFHGSVCSTSWSGNQLVVQMLIEPNIADTLFDQEKRTIQKTLWIEKPTTPTFYPRSKNQRPPNP